MAPHSSITSQRSTSKNGGFGKGGLGDGARGRRGDYIGLAGVGEAVGYSLFIIHNS